MRRWSRAANPSAASDPEILCSMRVWSPALHSNCIVTGLCGSGWDKTRPRKRGTPNGCSFRMRRISKRVFKSNLLFCPWYVLLLPLLHGSAKGRKDVYHKHRSASIECSTFQYVQRRKGFGGKTRFNRRWTPIDADEDWGKAETEAPPPRNTRNTRTGRQSGFHFAYRAWFAVQFPSQEGGLVRLGSRKCT